MTDLLLEKGARGLSPTNETGWQFVNKIRMGEKIVATLKDPNRRSSKQHRFWFALVGIMHDNQEAIKDFDKFRKYVVARTGRADVFKGPDETVIIPHSIAFGKMDADEFGKLLNDTLDIAEQKMGFNRDDLLAETQAHAGDWR